MSWKGLGRKGINCEGLNRKEIDALGRIGWERDELKLDWMGMSWEELEEKEMNWKGFNGKITEFGRGEMKKKY